jgi:hypothetical protein
MAMRQNKDTFSQQLIDAINSSGVTRYAIWKATGISEATLSRIVNGDGWIGREAADRLGKFLDLSVVTGRKTSVASTRRNQRVGRFAQRKAKG